MGLKDIKWANLFLLKSNHLFTACHIKRFHKAENSNKTEINVQRMIVLQLRWELVDSHKCECEQVAIIFKLLYPCERDHNSER